MGDVGSHDALTRSWHKVADHGELADGTIKPCAIAGVGLVVTRLGERYGALASRCPHAGGPLADGTLENGRLVCPWHGREYDPVTGICDGYVESVKAYAVEARVDGVYVAL